MIDVMIIVYSIFIPVLLFISGFAKAVMDLSEEGKIKLKPSRYWIKSMSSPNKWKDGDPRKGEKFFGSSRWFVALFSIFYFLAVYFELGFPESGHRLNHTYLFSLLLHTKILLLSTKTAISYE